MSGRRGFVRLTGCGPDGGAALVLSRWRFFDVFAAEAGQRIERHFDVRFAQNVRDGPVGCALGAQRCETVTDGHEHRMALRRRCGVGIGGCRDEFLAFARCRFVVHGLSDRWLMLQFVRGVSQGTGFPC